MQLMTRRLDEMGRDLYATCTKQREKVTTKANESVTQQRAFEFK
jgi:hypothetical protein